MSVELCIVLAILWWKSAELILIHDRLRYDDLRRRDLWWCRIAAILGPVVAAVVWLAVFVQEWLNSRKNNPVVKPRKQP